MPAKHTGGERRGNPENLVPAFAHLAHALSGVDLPKDKRGLLQYAESKDAEPEVIDLIGEMPDQEFRTMADIMTAAGKTGDTDNGDNRSKRLH